MRKKFFLYIFVSFLFCTLFSFHTPTAYATNACSTTTCGGPNSIQCCAGYQCNGQVADQFGSCGACTENGKSCNANAFVNECCGLSVCTDLGPYCPNQVSLHYSPGVCGNPPPSSPGLNSSFSNLSSCRYKIPTTLSLQSTIAMPFLWSSNGTITMNAQFSQIAAGDPNYCPVQQGTAGLPFYMEAIRNDTGIAYFKTSNTQYLLNTNYAPGVGECVRTDHSQTIQIPTDTANAGWYDVYITSYVPANPAEHDLGHNAAGCYSSTMYQVYVGPDTWTPSTKQCPVVPGPPPSGPTCSDMQHNSALGHGVLCNPAFQGDSTRTQSAGGKTYYLTCPAKGVIGLTDPNQKATTADTTCKQLFAGPQNPQTYCLYANEGEQKVQKKGDLCDPPGAVCGGGRQCDPTPDPSTGKVLQCVQASGQSVNRCQICQNKGESCSSDPCCDVDPNTKETLKCNATSNRCESTNGSNTNGNPPCGATLPCSLTPPVFPAYNTCPNGVCNTAIGFIHTDPQTFITDLFRIVLSVGGTIALIIIIYSGYQMMLSHGEPQKIQGAKETITAAIVGLFFIVFSIVILETIGVDILHIPGLGH